MPTYKRPGDVEDELHRLLLMAVPKNKFGNQTINHLATLLKIKRQSIGKWIANGRISPERVKQLVELGTQGEPVREGGRVTRADFERFVYND